MVVYKILRKKDGEYFAPYYGTSYSSHQLSTTTLGNPRFYNNPSVRMNYGICQGIHSFRTIRAAKDYFNSSVLVFHEDLFIVKAIVPKGSNYYPGYYDSKSSLKPNSIVSDSIQLTNEEIKLCVHS